MVLQFDGIWNYRQPTISRVFRTNNHRQRVVNDAGPTFAAPPQRLKLKAKPIVPSQTACRRTRPSIPGIVSRGSDQLCRRWRTCSFRRSGTRERTRGSAVSSVRTPESICAHSTDRKSSFMTDHDIPHVKNNIPDHCQPHSICFSASSAAACERPSFLPIFCRRFLRRSRIASRSPRSLAPTP